ncbi:prepilin-type N-terminal cleavage/methylation domain-containing protein [Pseudenhygromyxa sp. WMMC2535]|uniref:type IV pilus modification PilV family protein n=1 Tax=Pseudenhygromyxa sp. WMMC2535 TaxID=2712867 RepID=UPI001557A409|nr:prepilin-type N-terminal cleavage/methylation domain-containing protein [Pseudenhygromyxa sp. WMMC2535]NVB36716.1 prepilin-type N-terminal cleavage/methylation domain-containing protein [Pseudenhygromyxa sp. WMMC2535]
MADAHTHADEQTRGQDRLASVDAGETLVDGEDPRDDDLAADDCAPDLDDAYDDDAYDNDEYDDDEYDEYEDDEHRYGGAAGFTLLEVLIAVAILSVVMTSMLGSQLNSMQATRYARDISAAALLADWQIIELEWQHRKDGWTNSDVEVEGDFSDQGWDDITWKCTIHFIELPEYNQLIEAKDDVDEAAGDDDNMMDAGDQAFAGLGMVWAMIKEAIEAAIRKVDCEVQWTSGGIEQRYAIQTFWTDPMALQNVSAASDDEFTDEDDDSGTTEDSDTSSSSSSGTSTKSMQVGVDK